MSDPSVRLHKNKVRKKGPLRSGAALLIVIAVLLLLAILGTALLSTSQVERQSAYQHSENAQLDLYLQSMVNIAKGSIIGDLFGTGGDGLKSELRPMGFYKNHTSPLDQKWLAARVPEPMPPDSTRTQRPFDKFLWPTVSMPPSLADTSQSGLSVFRNPLDERQYSAYRLAAGSASYQGEDYPCFQWYESKTSIQVSYLAPQADLFVAGDADGDGIADCPMWVLEKMPRYNVTVLGGMRITDNCAAINVNTAWRRDFDLTASGQPVGNPSLTPSNTGLYELLMPATRDQEMAEINRYRFGYEGGNGAVSTVPSDEKGNRTEFAWETQAQAFYHGLGARMGNPAPNGNTRFRAFSISDQVALAYRFCLINSEAAPSALEQMFLRTPADSLYQSAANFQTDPRQMWKAYARDISRNESHYDFLDRWYTDNFDYDSGRYSLRPLLVTTNSVSNAVALSRHDIDGRGEQSPANPGMLPYVSQGEWSAGKTYRFGDVVRYKDRYYSSLRWNNGGQTPSGTTLPTDAWDYQPWSPLPQKTSLNTANFRELWRAFWLAMTSDSTGVGSNEARHYTQVAEKDSKSKPIPDPFTGAQRMKDVMQELLKGQTVELRAAMAAVNAMGMRDRSDDVIGRNITLYEQVSKTKVNKAKYRVSVFSNERQPVISEVLIQTGDTPWIAVELYNPWPQPIILKNWHFAGLKRAPMRGRGSLKFNIVNAGRLSDVVAEIPGGGLIVIENSQANRPADIQIKAGTTVRQLPALVNGFDGDLVLMRPRLADGMLTASTIEPNIYDEGSEESPRLIDFVPVDQIDLEYIAADKKQVSLDWLWLRNERDKQDRNKEPVEEKDRLQVGELPEPENLIGLRLRYARETVPADGSTPSNHISRWLCFHGGAYDAAFDVDRRVYPGEPGQPGDITAGVPWREIEKEREDEFDKGYPSPELSLTWRHKYEGMTKQYQRIQVDNPDFVPGVSPEGTLDKFFRWVPKPQENLGEYNVATYKALAETRIQRPGWPNGNPLAPSQIRFPFGMFQRTGDVLTVPLIGAITIRPTGSDGSISDPNAIFDMRAMTMDHDFIGMNAGSMDSAGRTIARNVGWPVKPAPSNVTQCTYLDFFTTRVTHDDYAPNIAPELYGYYENGVWKRLPLPTPIANDFPGRDNIDEPTMGVQGLVNVNTAPWIVLAQLPLVMNLQDGTVDHVKTVAAAKALAKPNHNGRRKFTDLFQVNETLLDFQYPKKANDPGAKPWEIMPSSNEPERYFEPLIRLSDMLTVRSDSFTVYIVVEGWRDAFTPAAKRVMQKRVAFIADRSAITETNRELRVVRIPTN